jgi:hypothetical protein
MPPSVRVGSRHPGTPPRAAILGVRAVGPLLALATCLSASHLGAARPTPQEPAFGIRVAVVDVEPQQPAFGTRFDLHLTLRVGPGLVLSLPDSLRSSSAVAGIGPPRERREAPAPGDSVDVSVTYSAIAFAEGPVDLPTLEIGLQPIGVIQEIDLGPASIASFVWTGGVDEVPERARPKMSSAGAGACGTSWSLRCSW